MTSKIRFRGATSGFVELAAPDAAGSNTLTLPTGNGTTGQYLQTDGAGALSWQTVTTGKILKVEQSSAFSTTASSSSSTFADTGLTASFTPSAAGSSILIIIYHGQGQKDASDTQIEVKLLRGTTDVGNTWDGLNNNGSVRDTNNPVFFVLDTPTYTVGDSVTYKTQFRNRDATGSVTVNGGGAYLTFLEVGA